MSTLTDPDRPSVQTRDTDPITDPQEAAYAARCMDLHARLADELHRMQRRAGSARCIRANTARDLVSVSLPWQELMREAAALERDPDPEEER